MIIALFEFVVMAIVLSIIITQVIQPLWKGTPLFPWVRTHQTESRLEHAREKLQIASLESERGELLQQVKSLKEKK